jgi:hypothetical protein
MYIRMTGMGTAIASTLAAGAVALGSLVGGSGDSKSHTALVMDAGLARDGRDLVAPRVRDLDAALRLPRTQAEAEADLRYFAAQGYRLLVSGPDSRAAAQATGLAAIVRLR